MIAMRSEMLGAATAKKRVLVVDDSSAMRRIVIRVLKEAGFGHLEPLEASNGADALAIARREKPLVILADWNMPVMDGLALVRALKAEGLISLCGLVTSEVARVRVEAFAAGAQFVLAKPVSADGLRSALAPVGDDGHVTIPAASAVSRMLGTLLGIECQALSGQKAIFAGAGQVLVGVYEREKGKIAALLACDVELAARVTAAMSGRGPVHADETIAKKQLSEAEVGDIREFFNVCSPLLGASHIQLASVHSQIRSLPPRAVTTVVRPASQGVYIVTLPGYGTGGLCVNVAD